MKRFLFIITRLFLALLLIMAGLLYLVVNHGAARQELVCKGHWKGNPSSPETAYVQLDEYRWWTRLLWALMLEANRSDGNVKVQTDKVAMSLYISSVMKTGEGRLALYSFHDYDFRDDTFGKFLGGYRAANREIAIEFAPNAVFIGQC